MTKSSGTHKERREPEEDTEQRILDAAHSVFLRRGTAGARMQEIAEEAGVNKALLHYYFRSKDRLAEAVFRRVAMRLLPPILQLLQSDAGIEEKVRQVIALEIEHLSRAPYMPGYLISELSHHPDRVSQLITAMTGMSPDGIRDHVLCTLERQIDERVRAGEMRVTSADQFVVNLLSVCIFPFAAKPILSLVMGEERGGFEAFIERRKRELPEFFLGALRP
jgi:AcrR family transcriptional regulator